MKVLVINTAPTGFTGITGVMLNYIRVTAEAVGYDFVLAGNVDPKRRDELQQYGEDIYIPPCSRVKNPLQYTSWLIKKMRLKKYAAVHVHGNSGTMFFEMYAAKRAGIPVRICHSHSSSCKFMLAHRVLKPLMNRIKTVGIACSDKAGDWLFSGDYVLLGNGIDITRFRFDPQIRQQYRQELGLKDNFVVGHIGYMDTEKNHTYLLRVFEELCKVRPDSKLLLIGDGRLRPQVEEQFRQSGLQKNVLALGKRYDAAQLYQCMDVFVLPSLYEGLPVSLVEAQTAGLPCVVSAAVTRQVDLVNNMQFVGIDEDDRGKWVEAILRECSADRISCGEAMEKSAFNIQNCASTLLKLYGVD